MSNTGMKLGVLYMCPDWRLHRAAVVNVLQPEICAILGVDAYDVQTAPGPDGVYAEPNRIAEASIETERTKFLALAHHAAAIGDMAHHRCAGFPCSDNEHVKHAIETAQKRRKAMPDYKGPIVAIVATYVNDDEWHAKEVGRF